MSGQEDDIIEVTIDMTELKKMKVPELKRKVAELGLPTKGTKAELLARVEKYLHEQEEEEEELLDDDEVEEEEEEEVDEEEGVVGDIEESNVSEDIPATAANSQVEAVEDNTGVQDNVKVSSDPKETEAARTTNKLATSKVGTVSRAECLVQRAARFGGNSSEEAKKIARAERFGTSLENGYKGLGKRATPTEEELGKMKKRAERFGSSVSPSITTVEEEEKKKKRLDRFGQKVTELGDEERKKARAAKFGSI